MHEIDLCEACLSKVENQPRDNEGVQYALPAEELCNECKDKNNILNSEGTQQWF